MKRCLIIGLALLLAGCQALSDPEVQRHCIDTVCDVIQAVAQR